MESAIAAAHNAVCLSCREREILTLVAEGATDNEIANKLSMSKETASWNMKQIRGQPDARSRDHAVPLALHGNLLPETPAPGQRS